MGKNIGEVLRANASELALVVGNGLLRASGVHSWEKMLKDRAILYPGLEYHDRKKLDLTLPELFELIEIKDGRRGSVRKNFFAEIEGIPSQISRGSLVPDACRTVLNWADCNNAPILTTNFDKTLEVAMGLKKFSTSRRVVTDFYPWEVYYSHHQIAEPGSGFAVWHIHGVIDYKRSIKLSLADYMAMVSRARGYIVGKNNALFAKKHMEKWRGSSTWLDIFFRRKLIFLGLGLQTQEVFLRWLLIQRKRYLEKNRISDMGVWFVIPTQESGDEYSGRRAFLDALDIKIIEVPNYSYIYDSEVWAA
jgi:hypothetical protein